MRNFAFSPALNRATVGFDQIANIMDRALSSDGDQPTYPPYNIEKISDDAWRISIAVAGFSDAELSVELRENALIISGEKAAEDEKRNYLHQGIAARAFKRRFQLADHVLVTSANHSNGMLHVELAREVPEALKPRRIAIETHRSEIEDTPNTKMAS